VIVIETERLLLRPPRADDLDAVAEAIGDAEVMRFIGNGETGDVDDAAAQIESMQRGWTEDGFGRFIVVRREDDAAIGRVGPLAWDPRVWRSGIRAEIGDDAEIELGWTLVRSAWGRGYATEAGAAARDWILREIRPRRLISLIHPENDASLRVANKLGEHFDSWIETHRGVRVQLWSF
jgi:RimJ/RimL family protein N-acetyltransferase